MEVSSLYCQIITYMLLWNYNYNMAIEEAIVLIATAQKMFLKRENTCNVGIFNEALGLEPATLSNKGSIAGILFWI